MVRTSCPCSSRCLAKKRRKVWPEQPTVRLGNTHHQPHPRPASGYSGASASCVSTRPHPVDLFHGRYSHAEIEALFSPTTSVLVLGPSLLHWERQSNATEPFVCPGFTACDSHESERSMAIRWRLAAQAGVSAG